VAATVTSNNPLKRGEEKLHGNEIRERAIMSPKKLTPRRLRQGAGFAIARFFVNPGQPSTASVGRTKLLSIR